MKGTHVNVCLATYQSVALLKGGPRTQILQTKRCLEALGVGVSLFESWQGLDMKKLDLVHLFGANIGTFHLAREIHKLSIPLVVSPIFYTRRAAPVVRAVVGVNGLVGKIVNGAWTDYGIASGICAMARAVLPNTAAEARLVSRGLGVPKEKIHHVPNGVEGRFADADPSLFLKEYGLENFVLNVGHIGPERKNVLRLIRALEAVEAPAVIIGRIEQSEYAAACLREAKKNPRLIIIDSLPNDSAMLASAYAACDVFALPSLYETPGIAALEAALAGAKIVITGEGGTREYFGAFAEYVDPSSAASIQRGIEKALAAEKDPALREHIRKEYLWERVAEMTRSVYEAVLSSAGAR